MSDALADLSEALAEAVETAGAGVVRVEGRRRLPASGIVWSADGVFLTAHHVVEQDENIGVGLPDGGATTAKVIGRDPTTDIAIMRAEARDLTPATWASVDGLRVGHLVLALGRPGENVMATLGIVSALQRDWRTPAGGQLDHFLQTDAVMYPGFSGGALVDARGHSIGLISSGLVRGMSIAVPAASVKRIVETLLAHGRVRRGYLGVGAQPVRLPAGLAAQLDQETGLLLGSVEADSPADRGGLFMGDTIVALDGQAVGRMDDLFALLSADRVNKDVAVRVVRGGQILDVIVRIGEH